MRLATSVLRRRELALAGVAFIIAAAVGTTTGGPVAVLAGPAPAYSIANVGAYGGEPSIGSARLGRLYDTTPQGGTLTYTPTNHGARSTQGATARTRSRADCLATGQANPGQ